MHRKILAALGYVSYNVTLVIRGFLGILFQPEGIKSHRDGKDPYLK